MKYQLLIFFESFVKLYLIGLLVYRLSSDYFIKFSAEESKEFCLNGVIGYGVVGLLFFGNTSDNIQSPKNLLVVLEFFTAVSWLTTAAFLTITMRDENDPE